MGKIRFSYSLQETFGPVPWRDGLLPCIGYWDGQYCRMSRVPTNIPQKRFGQLLHGRTCPVNDAVLCEFRCIFDLS